MILKASQRSGGSQLGAHLLRSDENEHVEVHEVRGFISESVPGAMREAYAVSRGTKCSQYLFSLSLNPPEHENVAVEVFEKALDVIEERLGLAGQPRIVVFHEKEGRRHAHAVWSRIDADTMTARPLPFFKTKLQEVSRQLFLENGWKMPNGLIAKGMGDPRNFSLAEWQQAKRGGYDAKETKAIIQQCWAASDGRKSFESSLEERGMFLARGDRRSYVIYTFDGEALSLSRTLGKKAKDLTDRLGDPAALRSIDETRRHIADAIAPRLSELIRIAKRNTASSLKPLLDERQMLGTRHRDERTKLDQGQRERWSRETANRSARLRRGIAGVWDRLNGTRAKTVKQNEMEAFFALQRDRSQRDGLIAEQTRERRQLQDKIKEKRREGATRVLALFADSKKVRDTNLMTDFVSRSSLPGGNNGGRRERPSRGMELS